MTIRADEFDIDNIRETWIGRIVSKTDGRYPVEYDAIRRHCHMTGDTNPLFLDPAIAKAEGPFGGVIVPPSALPLYFSSEGRWPRAKKTAKSHDETDKTVKRPAFTLGIPTPGDRGINMGTEWAFHEPIRVGDQLHSEQTVTDVFIKGIKLDPLAVWIVSEINVYNQHETAVATWRNTTLVHRSPAQVRAEAGEHGDENS